MEQVITLTLTVEEANAVLAALGQLPTSTGVFPLLRKIKEQGDAQVPAAPATTTETDTESEASE